MRSVGSSCRRFGDDRRPPVAAACRFHAIADDETEDAGARPRAAQERLTVDVGWALAALSIEPKKGESPRRRAERRGEGLKPQTKILFCIMCTGMVLAPAGVGFAAVATMPSLNIAPTCESEGRKAMALGNSSIEACKRSELEARHALGKKWSHYEAADRATCMGRISHGGHPSYVELQSCLESFRHAREIRAAHAKARTHSTAHAK
jgi:hypothetical protein